MNLKRYGVPVFLISLLFSTGNAQVTVPGRTNQMMEERKEYILALHDSIKGTDRILVNGEVYFPHQQGAINDPFFAGESWMKGDLTIMGQHYTDCLLRYDIFLDQLLYLHIANGANTLALNREMVSSFKIGNSRFEFLGQDELSFEKKMPVGYYELVYAGNPALFARWSKRRIRNDGFRRDEFQQDVRLYLCMDNQFISFRNDRQLRNALGKYSREIRQFMKQRNIHVKIDSPAEVGLVVAYFEELNRKGR